MIRPLAADDLPEVVALYQRVIRGGGAPPGWLEEYFRSTLLDHPWYDADLPSLVSEERDGTISGLIGVHARRLRFDGRPIRLACSGQLVADPSVGGAPGLFLMRTFLAGAQDVSITDGANASARAIWTRLGGVVRERESISWLKALRPTRAALDVMAGRMPRGVARSGEAALGGVMDALWLRRSRGAAPGEHTSTALDAGTLADLLPDLSPKSRVAPAYDAAFAQWLLASLERSADGIDELRARVVELDGSRRVGAFVYYRRPGGRSEVISVLARSGSLGHVLDVLFDDARAGGAAILTGRLEPGVAQALDGRRCLLRHTGEALVHSRDEPLLRAIQAGEASLTRLEGEYWMIHHAGGT